MKAADEGLNGLKVFPGEEPMERAWRKTLNSVVDQIVQEDPSREGAIATMDLKVDPGPFPGTKYIDRRSLAVSVALGAVLGAFAVELVLPPLPATWVPAQWIGAIGASLGAVGAVFFARPKEVPDMGRARAHLALLAELTCKTIEATTAKPVEQARKNDGDIARALYDLKNASPDGLVAAAEGLLIEAANGGYEGLRGTPSFVKPSGPSVFSWSADLLDRYEPFGYYDEGDPVMEERAPIVKDGVVLEKGVVRRASR